MAALQILSLSLSLMVAAAADSAILLVGCYHEGSPAFNQYFTPQEPSGKAASSVAIKSAGLVPLRYAGHVKIRGIHYIIGGLPSDNDPPVDSVQIFDPETNKTMLGVPLPQPRCLHTAEAYNSKIYVCGGYVKSSARYHPPSSSSSCIMFDVVMGGEWTSLPDLPVNKYAAVSAVINGRLYITGGSSAGTETYLLDLNDASSGWHRMDDMPSDLL